MILSLALLAAIVSILPPTHHFGPSPWIDGGELLTYEVPRSPVPLTRVRVDLLIESRCRFTFAQTGGTVQLLYAGAGLRLWTPAEYAQWERRMPGVPFIPSNIGWSAFVLPFPSAAPLHSPGVTMRGRGVFAWSHNYFNSEGIGTPQHAHSRWPTLAVNWPGGVYLDIKTAQDWSAWILETEEEIGEFVGDGTATLRLSPTFTYRIFQEAAPWVDYIPIRFERRVLEMTVRYFE